MTAIKKGQMEPYLKEFYELWGRSYGYGYGPLVEYGKDGKRSKPGHIDWLTARLKAKDGEERRLPYKLDATGNKYWLLPLTPRSFWKLFGSKSEAIAARPGGHTCYLMADLQRFSA